MTLHDILCWLVFFFKQKTAYEMRISDWSSDVCSSDLRTTTLSPFLILSADISKHLRRQADDLHMIASAQLANHRTKDTGDERLLVLVDKHRGVGIEPDHRPIGTEENLVGPKEDGAMNVPLLHTAEGSGGLHRHTDTVAKKLRREKCRERGEEKVKSMEDSE